MQPWYEMQIFGNEVWRWFGLLGSVLLLLAAGRIGRRLMRKAADRIGQRDDRVGSDALRTISGSLELLALPVGLKLGAVFVILEPGVRQAADTVNGVLVVVALAWMGYDLCGVVSRRMLGALARTSNSMDDMLVPFVRKSLRVMVVLFAAIHLATMLSDKPVTSMIAGLGIGGLALALASQETLKNLFGSLVILSDKPFVLGDNIVVDRFAGIVEGVGFRSTRLRTEDGDIVAIPNGDLANKFIVNISHRRCLRRTISLRLPSQTSPEKVARALAVLQKILDHHEGMPPDHPPQVYFEDVASDALTLKAIYWYQPADLQKHMAFNQRVNLAILNHFHEEQIAFAV